jgi:hypothetical protein
MEGVPKASRRNLLRNGLLLLGGALGLGIAGARGAAVSGVDLSRVTTFRLTGKQWHLFATDRRRGEIPVRGDSISTHGTLHGPDGSHVGEFYSAGLVLNHPLGAMGLSAGNLEMHTFLLKEGTIAGMGAAGPGESVFAVVGGTGRYAGASGSYVARQRPLELGGDGTAEFTVTLKAGEGTHGR